MDNGTSDQVKRWGKKISRLKLIQFTGLEGRGFNKPKVKMKLGV